MTVFLLHEKLLHLLKLRKSYSNSTLDVLNSDDRDMLSPKPPKLGKSYLNAVRSHGEHPTVDVELCARSRGNMSLRRPTRNKRVDITQKSLDDVKDVQMFDALRM